MASLGEYEQAVPIIEKLKTSNPDLKFLVSFFSPSGYEVKKNSKLVDIVVYLPLDTSANAKRFVKLINPKFAVFIKYEIWPNYLKQLKKQEVPVILASALFRESQLYFKGYGGFMRKALKKFDHIFVQDIGSLDLLHSIKLTNVSISGDTRFDRVSHQIEQDNTLDFISDFLNNSLCIVCGSTWPEDDTILVDYINEVIISEEVNVKFIIAPHEIKKEKINSLINQLDCNVVSYSEKDDRILEDFDVFIIDTIGLLTKIYSYADIAYVGGAMGTSGLHNILEPATFGIPIIIGENFEKFPEAKKLQQLAGLYSVSNNDNLRNIMNKLVHNKNLRQQTGMIAGHYVNSNTGATNIITSYIEDTLKQ